MKKSNTFEAKIYCGLREGYDGSIHNFQEAIDVCQEYCNIESFCVTLTETTFIYKDGREPGFIVGIINYPRIPRDEFDLSAITYEIAKIVKLAFKQKRVTIVFEDESVTIGED